MLARHNRLQSQKDFKSIYKRSRVINTTFFSVRYAPNRLVGFRFGIVISKKIFSKAVKRNKLKRQITSILTQKITNKQLPCDIIIIARKAVVKASFAQIKQDIDKVLGVIYEKSSPRGN